MNQDLKDLAAAIQSAEVQALIPKGERFNLSSLASLTDMISAKSKIKLKRGYMWSYDPSKKELIYDEQMLLGLPPEAAPGLIFHNVGHANHSTPKKENLSKYKSYVADTLCKGNITPDAVYDLVEAAEDERMENILSHDYENLRNTYLPRCDKGWRDPAFREQRQMLDTPTMPGEMIKTKLPNGKTIEESKFYKRVATAIRGLVSGALDAKDLPADMQWSPELIREIKNLRDCPTVDELLENMKKIIQKITQQRIEPPPSGGGRGDEGEGEEGEGEGEGDGEGDGEGNGNGNGKGKGQGQGQGNKPGKGRPSAVGKPGKAPPPPKPQEVKAETQRASTSNNGNQNPDKKGFVNSGGGAGFDPDKTYTPPPWQGPPWSIVAQSAANIIPGIRTAVRRHLKDNENVDKVHGHKTGKLAGNKMVKGYIGKHNNVFTKYEEEGQRNYAVYLLVDVSGSMESADSSINAYPELDGFVSQNGHLHIEDTKIALQDGSYSYGYGGYGGGSDDPLEMNKTLQKIQKQHGANQSGHGTRWSFACRLAVAIAETLRRFKEVQVAMGSYTDGAKTTKPLKSPFNPEREQMIMDDFASPRGGTSVGRGLQEARKELIKSRAEKKLIICITDGDFGDRGMHLKEFIENMRRKDNIDTVVLTVGLPASHAAASVGPDHADQVTDDNVGMILGKHIKRMVK